MATWLTADPKTLWPHLDSARLEDAKRLIERAESIVLQRFPSIPTRIQQRRLSTEVVAGVVEDMVTRAIAKEDRGGLTQLAYPEVTMQWETDGALGQGSRLWLTTDEIVLLSPQLAQGAWSIRRKATPTLPEDRC